MTDRADKDGARRRLRAEAAEWFAVIRGPDAPAAQDAFSRWLAEDARHREAYNRIAETFSLGRQLGRAPAGTPPDRVPLPRWLADARVPARAGLAVVGALAAGLMILSPTLRPSVLSGVDRTAPGSDSPAAPRLLTTTGSDIRLFVLGGDTRITLDAASAVAVSEAGGVWDARLLRGRARLVPPAGRRVRVRAGAAQVTATAPLDIGYDADGRISISPLHGSVEIVGADRPPLVIGPGRQAIAEARTGAVQVVATRRSDRRWPEGLRDYEAVSLQQVLDEANRYAGRPLLRAAPGIGQRTIAGTFRVTRPRQLAANLAALLDLQMVETEADGLMLVPAAGSVR